jgi:dihydroorotate dehydrogenase
MGAAYDLLFNHALSRIDAEHAHKWGFAAIRAGAPAIRGAQRLVPELMSSSLRREVMGLMFAHPIGLAAGFDKNAVGIDALAALGFSHIEVGTVTAQAQPGNPKPRLFRLPEDRALINRMGFNNDGAEVVARRLKHRKQKLGPAAGQVVLGVNIGKSKVVDDANEAAVIDDYVTSATWLAPYAGYLVVNVSSPNTPGLRNLQTIERLEPILLAVRDAADEATPDSRVPLLVKIAPDLEDADLVAVAQLASSIGLDGIIATNTTVSRANLTSPNAAELGAGGVSGQPLTSRALAVLKILRDVSSPQLTLVAAGGVETSMQAQARLAAGAALVQVYTGFVYGGPTWPGQLLRGLRDSQPT